MTLHFTQLISQVSITISNPIHPISLVRFAFSRNIPPSAVLAIVLILSLIK